MEEKSPVAGNEEIPEGGSPSEDQAPETAMGGKERPQEVPAGEEALKELRKSSGGSKGSNIDFILDIPLHVSVELGRTRMTISELLQLGEGSVVELNKIAGEPVEVMVNEKLVARGEVVRVNEKLGVRLTDILTPAERIEQLR